MPLYRDAQTSGGGVSVQVAFFQETQLFRDAVGVTYTFSRRYIQDDFPGINCDPFKLREFLRENWPDSYYVLTDLRNCCCNCAPVLIRVEDGGTTIIPNVGFRTQFREDPEDDIVQPISIVKRWPDWEVFECRNTWPKFVRGTDKESANIVVRSISDGASPRPATDTAPAFQGENGEFVVYETSPEPRFYDTTETTLQWFDPDGIRQVITAVGPDDEGADRTLGFSFNPGLPFGVSEVTKYLNGLRLGCVGRWGKQVINIPSVIQGGTKKFNEDPLLPKVVYQVILPAVFNDQVVIQTDDSCQRKGGSYTHGTTPAEKYFLQVSVTPP